MATSGVYSLELTLNGLLEQAYDALQVGQDGETLTADFYNRATRTLNVMLKTWESQGIHLWTMQEGALFLNVGQYKYPFGDATTHLANDYHKTESTSANSTGDTVISVSSTEGLSNGDPVGVIGQDNNLQWSTTASFVPNVSITLTNALTVDAGANAVVYYYPLNDFKPVMRVLDVRRQEGAEYEVPINFISREAFFSLPNKENQGFPIQAYYSRDIPDGTMYVWSSPSSSVPVIRFTYERKMQIMSQAEQTFDIPEYWYEAMIYNLALRLMPVYGCSPSRIPMIAGLAQQSLSEALSFDTDLYPITIQMGRN